MLLKRELSNHHNRDDKTIMLSKRITCNLEGRALLRREALQVFHEICELIPDAKMLNSVSITPTSKPGEIPQDFELRIKIGLGPFEVHRVRSIVKKHDLDMREEDGILIIHAPENVPVSVAALA